MRTIPDKYHGVDGHLKMVEAEYLYNVPFRLGGGHYGNIGTMYGRSAVHLAGGLKDSGALGKVVTVDNTDYNAQVAFEKRGVARHIISLLMDSVKASSHFADNSFQFVFIDGDHSYEGVKRDFEAWEPKIVARGEVAFHDSNVEGVKQFLRELEASGKWVRGGTAHTLSWWKRC